MASKKSEMAFRALVSLAVAALLQACSTPPTKTLPPTTTPPPATVVKFDAVLQPGCLMQVSPGLPAASGTAALQLRISTTGQVLSASVATSSGSAPLDALLLASARRCTFAPAFRVGGPDHVRTEVEDDYTLSVAWPAPPLVGPLRCFRPDYPHLARRREEEGTVVVDFSLRASDGTLETRVRPGSAAGPRLRELSVRAVETCLRHEEARTGLKQGAWYAIPYSWRLE